MSGRIPTDRSDFEQLDEGNNGNGGTPANICNVIYNTVLSDLEYDLGQPGPSQQLAVCSNGQVISPFIGMTPSAILKAQDPYFLDAAFMGSGNAAAYAELWAQQFVLVTGGQGGGTDPLLFIDSAATRLNCSYTVVNNYFTQGVPPPTSQLTGSDCPPATAADFLTIN